MRRGSPLTAPRRPGTPLGLYLHIPFCRKRCHFCYFRVYTDKDATAIKGYLDLAIRELELYAAPPFIGGAQAFLRLFRRRHAVVPFRGPTQPPDRPHEGAPPVGRG